MTFLPRTLLPALLLSGLATATPMKLADYMALTGPAPSAKFASGSAPSQYAELFRPAGKGPFPVAVLVHGGCWTVKYGGIAQLRNLAGALAAQGIAVWNVEYRRADEPGGGYPGTYQDIDAALDLLGTQAGKQHLDLGRIVAIGHSAGGQLVQWIAGRAHSRVEPAVPDASAAGAPDHQPGRPGRPAQRARADQEQLRPRHRPAGRLAEQCQAGRVR